jgi:hypothetical protein
VGPVRFGGNDNVGAVASKPQGHGPPDAATGSGDDDGFAYQVAHDNILFLKLATDPHKHSQTETNPDKNPSV